ncbi:MFS general substrate transporter [Ramaria rubella]|nr:MFS general substrate transporter [Ramaria rubella]
MDEKRTTTTDQSDEDYLEPPDLSLLHEARAGRLVVDPEKAIIEFGDRFAAHLKLNKDSTKVLWLQPSDSPDDPQNWSSFKKNYLLVIVTLAAIIPEFDSGIGIIFVLSCSFDTTPEVINKQTASWSIFLLGWGGIFALFFINRFGRLPVLFWTQLLALLSLVGCTFSPNLKVCSNAVLDITKAYAITCPQVTGLLVVRDLFPFHLQARKLNLWTYGFILSPFLGPFAFGFLVARDSWRWAYGIGCMYGAIVLALIVLFMEETMYDRGVHPTAVQPYSGITYRVHTLLGTTGMKLAKYRASIWDAISSPFRVLSRPYLVMALIYEGVMFGFCTIITIPVFLAEPRAMGGFELKPFGIAGCYATPIIGVIIGELVGRYANDTIADFGIRHNKGVFKAEMRLWMCYPAVLLFMLGFLVIGASFQHQLTIGALLKGWGIAQCSCMLTTVSIYAYLNDCFPRHPGEVSALIHLARTLGGFSVAYFQVPWAQKNGAMQTFGCEVAVVVGLFVFLIPLLQWKGRHLRVRFYISAVFFS